MQVNMPYTDGMGMDLMVSRESIFELSMGTSHTHTHTHTCDFYNFVSIFEIIWPKQLTGTWIPDAGLGAFGDLLEYVRRSISYSKGDVPLPCWLYIIFFHGPFPSEPCYFTGKVRLTLFSNWAQKGKCTGNPVPFLYHYWLVHEDCNNGLQLSPQPRVV